MKSEDMNKRLLNRREFNGLCAALGSSLPAVATTIAALSSESTFSAAFGAASNDAERTVKFHDGTIVPALGQGSAESRAREGIRKLSRKKRCARAFRSG